MPKYLEKRRRRWHAVLDVPKGLRGKIGKPRFVQSLKTESLTEAERLVLPVVAGWKAEIEAARTGSRAPVEELMKTAASWGAEYRNLKPEQRPEALMLIADKAEDISYKDGKLASDFLKVATSESVVTESKIEDWLATLDNEPKSKDMKRSDVKRLAQVFPLTHQITKQGVQRWVHTLETEGGLKTNTVRRIISACRTYWHYLQASGSISDEVDPFIKAVPKKAKVSKAAVAEKRRPFTADEVVGILRAAADKGDTQLVQLIWLAMWTGCRIEELCSLTTGNVHSHHIVIEDAKSEAGWRDVPIHPKLKPVLDSLKATSTDGFIMSDLTLNKYGDRSNAIGKRFGRLKEALGFGAQYVFHSIRKTVATKLENAGVAENVAADILGHEKPNITFGLYSGGTSLEVRQAAIELIDYPISVMPD
ncbi:tyrosine-type recombinase/integrase [Cereibacter sphaeroides]|uniref:tyrosine-type recombinase/integrase n=1 Tax=Cereibacter sphaeroides TaxID=1063 RepID=UPI003FCC6DCA